MAASSGPKVLHVTPWYPDEDHPVAGRFVREHIRATTHVARCAVIHLVPGSHVPAVRHRLAWGVDIDSVPTVRVHYGSGLWAVGGLLAGLTAAWRGLSDRVGRFDLVHAHVLEAALPVALLVRARRTPYVVTEHWSAFLPEDPADLGGIRRLVAPMALRGAARVLPVSRTLERAMRTVAPGARYEIVPNIVDADVFRSRPASMRDRDLTVAGIGLMTPGKGFDVLIRAHALVTNRDSNARLILVGDGPQRAHLEELALELGVHDSVTFAGMRSPAEVSELLARSWLVAVASWYESFSLVAAESLAVGRPVVATQCGGPEEFVGADHGMLVPVGDERALAEAILRVAATEWDPERLGLNVRQEFGRATVAARLAAIYEAVLREQGRQ